MRFDTPSLSMSISYTSQFLKATQTKTRRLDTLTHVTKGKNVLSHLELDHFISHTQNSRIHKLLLIWN